MSKRNPEYNILSLISIAATALGPFILLSAYLRSGQVPLLLAAAGYLCLAGGLCGIFYWLKYRRNEELVKAALALGGFAVADTGWNKPDGKYDVKGVVNGVEMWLNGMDFSSKEGGPCLELEILCKVVNRLNARLAVYPSGFLYKPLFASLPPKIGYVPYWDWYAIHSEPAGAAEKLLSGARLNGIKTVFQDKYGFKFLELKGDRLRCVFKHALGMKYLRETTGQVAVLAASI